MINERIITDKKLIEYIKPMIISYYENTFLKSGSGKEKDSSQYIVEAEKLYQKLFENITNGVVTNLCDNISPMSSPTQKESSEQNSDDMQTSSDYLHAKEESALSDPKHKRVERSLFKERHDVPADNRMTSYPYRGQAWHPNFDQNSEI